MGVESTVCILPHLGQARFSIHISVVVLYGSVQPHLHLDVSVIVIATGIPPYLSYSESSSALSISTRNSDLGSSFFFIWVMVLTIEIMITQA